jgi:chain length determinant protein tyrosine kinase EpsG
MKTETGRKSPKSTDLPNDRGRAIGDILIEQGRLTPEDVEEILHLARANNLRFGDAAVQMKRLSPSDIDMAIAQQFNYPVLSCGPDGVTPDVIAAYEPQSERVEALRVLRSQLILRWRNPASRNVLAVTSPGRSEGRSWLCANLATMFAQLGERTLLIDSDMRNPSQHNLFNLSNTVGLSALLTGRAGREIVRRIHPKLRLYVLTAGNLPPNPQELLGRPVFDVVLAHFADQFDVVVLDTPAATDSADAQILAAHAGAAILLARRNHTRHAQLRATMQCFAETGVNVIGSVMNEYEK